MAIAKILKLDFSPLFPLTLSGCRSLIGLLWLASLRWKLPPTFAAPEGQRSLLDWLHLEVAHPSLGLYATFVSQVVIPNFTLFAWLTFLVELVIGLSLLLGLFTWAGAILGLLWSFNLALGLLEVPGEWPWSYIMLIMWQGMFLVSIKQQTFGLDAWRRRKHQKAAT